MLLRMQTVFLLLGRQTDTSSCVCLLQQQIELLLQSYLPSVREEPWTTAPPFLVQNKQNSQPWVDNTRLVISYPPEYANCTKHKGDCSVRVKLPGRCAANKGSAQHLCFNKPQPQLTQVSRPNTGMLTWVCILKGQFWGVDVKTHGEYCPNSPESKAHQNHNLKLSTTFG